MIDIRRENRYKRFNEKINRLICHPKYEWLRKYADDAIRWNECVGYYQIKAEDFIERIESADIMYIIDWLESGAE